MWIEIAAIVGIFYYFDKQFSRLEDLLSKKINENKEDINRIDMVVGRISERVNGLSSPDLYHIEKKLESIEEMLQKVEISKKEEPFVDNEVEKEMPISHLESFRSYVRWYSEKIFESDERVLVLMCKQFDPPNDEILNWCRDNLADPVLNEFIKKYFPAWIKLFPEIKS